MAYKIYWSEEAVRNLDEILIYLNSRWTSKEINKFKNKLAKQLELISHNPLLFPVSQNIPELRKAVLTRQTTIYYQLRDDTVYLAYLFVNKKDITKIV